MYRALALAFAVAACGGSSHDTDGPVGGSNDGGTSVDADPSCPDPGATFSVKAQAVVDAGLVQPVYLAQAPGDNDTLYVVEKPGRVRLIRGGSLVATPFLDVTSTVNIPETSAEGGLLSIAFAPDYQTSGRFFVFETVKADAHGGDRVAILEFHRSSDPDVASPTGTEIFKENHGGSGHVGGTVAFGPDGYLWAAIGDNGNDPNAQDLSNRLGKVVRIDVDHPSTPPPGGLAGAAPNIWDYGLRNPYRFSFDAATGQMYLADSGDELFEEVDIEAPASGGHDFGWPRIEGRVCHDGSSSCGSQGTLPQYVLGHDASYSVIIGGTVYRGSAIPNMRCRYVYAVFGIGRVLSFRYTGGADASSLVELTDSFGNANIVMVTSIVADNAGELYMTTINGAVFKIVPA